MKNVLHPSWIPAPAPDAVTAVGIDSTGGAQARASGTTSASTPAADPWANPIGTLVRGATPSADAAARRETHTDRVIAYLRAHGPSRGAVLCDHLGINKETGITVAIGRALSTRQIIRIQKQYYLPDQLPVSGNDSSDVDRTREQSAECNPAAEARPPHEPAPIGGDRVSVAPVAHARIPDFTLTVSDAMLLSWPDGAVTVQRAGSFVELTPAQSKLLGMLDALRK